MSQIISRSGGTPGGSDTNVQFNDGGVFGGDAGLTYDKTTDTLTVAAAINCASAYLSNLNGVLGADLNIVTQYPALDTTADNIIISPSGGNGTGNGGDISLTSGSGGSDGNGGLLSWVAGTGGATSGNGGSLDMRAGGAIGGGDGGNVFIEAGTGTGGGVDGEIRFSYNGSTGATIGDVWELQDATTGAGAWATPTGGGLSQPQVMARISIGF